VIEEIKVVLENESKKKDDIEKNIDKFQKKIIEKRQTLGGINAGVENQSALTKQVITKFYFYFNLPHLLKKKIDKNFGKSFR
jgi:hypothetical protein